ncbi:MAG: TrkH family potassium uptake protein [Parachlamydiaceae bacterium]|nr:TrkH family potassium uptake protein [Parachlamydiaceae bacterium]
MNFRDIFKILGVYFFAFAGLMLLPMLIAVYYQFFVDPAQHPQPHSTLAFFESVIVCAGVGSLFYFFGRNTSARLYKKESIALVVIIWFLTPALAAFPFTFSNTLSNPLQSYFEAVSGLTTTGATTMQAKVYNAQGQEIPIQKTFGDAVKTTYTFYGTIEPIRDPVTNKILYEGIEAVSKALLFWRSFLQWLGGLGVVVLFVAILPALGVSGVSSKLLVRSEMTGPIKDALAPRATQAAIQLLWIYVCLNIIQITLLMVFNDQMQFLDAVTISFSTVSGGGYSIRNASIGSYNNVNTDWIVILFMIIGSMNFTIYYYAVRGQFYRISLPELWIYLSILLIGCIIGSWYLVGTEKVLISGDTHTSYTVSEAIRYGTFQVVSAQTSSGFVTADYEHWPYVVQCIMLIAMFVGGMSGSTAGGFKIVRHYILFKIAQYKIESLFRSETVRQIKAGGQEIDEGTSFIVLTFFWVAICCSVLGTFFYIVQGLDMETSLGLVGCMVNNVGLGFRMAGPVDSCAFLSNAGLILSSFLMILGRLEYLVVLAIMMPSFWKETS